MVDSFTHASLDDIFGALADHTRRQILATLAAGPRSTSALAQPFEMSLPAVSKHIVVLERAGLVEREVVGRERVCRLVPSALVPVSRWLQEHERFWHLQLDRLSSFVSPEKGRSPWKQSATPRASRFAAPSKPRGKRSLPPGRRRKR